MTIFTPLETYILWALTILFLVAVYYGVGILHDRYIKPIMKIDLNERHKGMTNWVKRGK